MWEAERLKRSATLVDGKQLAAVCRIKPLRRLHCCALPVLCWGGAGASGNRCEYYWQGAVVVVQWG